MPTDKEIKQLVLNVLTEEQYASIAKKEDELYLTPDDSDEIKKLIPTDIDIKDNKLGLAHDSTWLTNKNTINLGDGLIYDKETRTLKARGGGAVSPILNLMDRDRVRTSITAEEEELLSKRSYSRVLYVDPTRGEQAYVSIYFPEIIIDGSTFIWYKVSIDVSDETNHNIKPNHMVICEIRTGGQDPVSGEYPITITQEEEILLQANDSIPALPSDASTSTYVLKAVNGTLTWIKE